MTPDGLGLVHRWEPGDDASGLVLLLLHGTGADENDLLPLGRALAPGASLLSPRGKVQEQGRVNRWFARHAEGVLDTDDLRRRAEELAGFVDAAADTYGFDTSRVVAVGFSNGANIAAGMLLLGHVAVRGAVLFAPMLPLEPEERPDLDTVGVFISSGRQDPICLPEQAELLASLLTDAGAAVELHFHPGGHALDRSHVALARDWVTKFSAAIAASPGDSPP